LRLALSIARSYELIRLPIDYSTESIEADGPYGPIYEETKQQFSIFLEKFTHKYPWYLGSLQNPDVHSYQFPTNLSKGPNGPAVACAHLDARAVLNNPTLYLAITQLNAALEQDWITGWLECQGKLFNDGKSYFTGRLGFSAEPGGKTRIFAIGDYWSQTSLKVIQTSLYNTLKSISTDSTKDQDKGFKTLIQESIGKPTFCFDLSSASDRIPAKMQMTRLELMGGRKLAEAWLSIMTERDFYIKAENRSVRWKVGQPLGLLSSFPSFALWHHDIVQFAYNRLRERKGLPLKFFRDYRLLGDDVVIFNAEVAGEYQILISDICGISINYQKSIVGDSKNSQIEFTKRLALRGKEMSSIKHNILSKNNMQCMLDLVDILYERDFISKDTGHYGLYPFLSSEEKIRFNFLFWFRSPLSHPFRVNDNLVIERDFFNEKLMEARYQNLKDKTMNLTKFPGGSLGDLYKKHSLPCNDKALGSRPIGELIYFLNEELHPLVWALEQTGLDVNDTLALIWEGLNPDVAPVEYLPAVSKESYFYTPRKRSKEFLSKLILDVYKKLSDETQLE
jgi:hypothetical protein